MQNHRDLLTINDLSEREVRQILARAATFKTGNVDKSLADKAIVFVFEKASTRTRIGFEVGVARLGAHPVVLDTASSQIARGEPLKDTARILAGYCDGIIMRTFGHERIEEMAHWSEVPVINALTDLVHPCQVLSDCFTLQENFGDLAGRKIAWIGDGNNMAHSWINAAGKLGFELVLACPEGYDPDADILAAVPSCRVVRNIDEAVKGAIAVNTDVWASMGQEDDAAKRIKAFDGYQINSQVMQLAAPEAVFMHCLPAHREEEVTAEVLEGRQSVVWEQARNRLFVQEAIMEFLIKD